MAYTVKSVAKLASVTVRTLHHYDRLGLLRPAELSPAGYRLYTQANLERLQQVLFFRELGFSLQAIKAIVDSPRFDARDALRQHRRLLLEKRARLDGLISAVDLTLQAAEGGETMSEKQMFEGFDDKQMEEYREEARQRWGAVVDESHARVSKYSQADWSRIGTESQAINEGMAALMGHDPAEAAVQDLVGRWFKLINENYYDCSPEVFRALGEMYVEDSRFTATYDKVRPGLAPFMRDAMGIYADRLEGKA